MININITWSGGPATTEIAGPVQKSVGADQRTGGYKIPVNSFGVDR